MPSFFERVCAQLAQDGYPVEGDKELGSGGMGIVVLARQLPLNRRVAIKVIRPELHTAAAAARFLHEAQTLADLPHPHIVPIYTVQPNREFPYYVMQYLDGDTVAQRLEDGPIPGDQVLKLGRDLLEALEHAHKNGVIHRDVKPGNVFWDGKHAVLTDFGIAKRVTPGRGTAGEPLTDAGMQVGTRDYMAPELLAGVEATPASDQYAAALVIYEAYAGRHWRDAQQAGTRIWRGVPWLVRSKLARALADQADERWPDVATFKRKFWRTRVAMYQLRAAAIGAGGLLVGAVFGVVKPLPPHPGLPLTVASFADVCQGSGTGHRVSSALIQNLRGYADFFVESPTLWSRFRKPSLVIEGTVCERGNWVEADVTLSAPRAAVTAPVRARASAGRLDELADTLAYGVVRAIWDRTNPLDSALPLQALPRTGKGLAAWLTAEKLFAQARWGEADAAYAAAVSIDSTCWLCSWRRAEVDKWLSQPFDSARYAGVMAHLESFPKPYRTVIRAFHQPLREALGSLESIIGKRKNFLPALFELADETYHRGPLIAASPGAIERLQSVVEVRPDFLPAVEHLTWAMAAAGEERDARADLERLMASGPPHDPYVQELRVLLTLGVTCRFESAVHCRDAITAALGGTDVAQYPDLAAGPRYLMTFDAPAGAVDLGRRFAARRDTPALVESGLVAELSGYLALGLVDSARTAATALRGLGRPELTVLPAELDGALLLLDPPAGDVRQQAAQVTRELIAHTRSSVSTAATRRRASWMLVLLARRGAPLPDSSYLRLLEGEEGRRPLRTLLDADRLARQGRIPDALRLTDSLTALQADSLGDPASVDPFFRTTLHLLRADWLGRLDDPDAVVPELEWYQNNDVVGLPSGPPQVADIDWAARTLARWREAAVLDSRNDRRACDLYLAVHGAWSAGDPIYRVRADSALTRARALHCRVPASS